MKNYKVNEDIEIIKDLLDLNESEFADAIGVSRMTVSRWKSDEDQISANNLNKIYDYAFEKRIYLNKIKEQLFREECSENGIILFHGAKTVLDGPLSVERAKPNNDFGKGFYCGESLEQSAMFVANYPESSIYILEFDPVNLNRVKLNVDRDWMLLIAYFRNKLQEYEDHPIIKETVEKVKGADYIIAPIADNRMFEIIDSFIDGEITDVQCQHCLSATNLGNQYVFVTQRALEQVQIVRHCYLAQKEKKFYISSRQSDSKISNDKVKVAKKKYRGQGKYIEEMLGIWEK